MYRRVWKRKRGTSWTLYWDDDGGHQRSQSLGADVGKRTAEDRRQEQQAKLNAGELGVQSVVRVFEFSKAHCAMISAWLQPKSVKAVKEALNSFAAEHGDMRLDRITAGHVEAWFAARLMATRTVRRKGGLEFRKRLSPATANKGLRELRSAFQAAIKRGLLRRNPCDGVKAARVPDREIRALTAEEVGKLLHAAAQAPWRAFLALAVTTGMREEELCNLRWEDLNFPSDVVRIVCHGAQRTKSARNRTATLLPGMAMMLRELPRRGGFVFLTSRGTKYGNNLIRRLVATCTRAGIARCTVQDLRRTFLSALSNAGVNALVVRQMAGHASLSTTQRFYTAIQPDSQREAAARLPYAEAIMSFSCHPAISDAGAKTA